MMSHGHTAGRRSREPPAGAPLTAAVLSAAIQSCELGMAQLIGVHVEPDQCGARIRRHVQLRHLQRVHAEVVMMRLPRGWTGTAVAGSAIIGAPLYGPRGQQIFLRIPGARG